MYAARCRVSSSSTATSTPSSSLASRSSSGARRVQRASVAMRPLVVLWLLWTTLQAAVAAPSIMVNSLIDREQPCVPSTTAKERLCRIPANRLHGAPQDTAWYAFAPIGETSPKLGDAPMSASSPGVFPGGALRGHLFGTKRAHTAWLTTAEVLPASAGGVVLLEHDEREQSFTVVDTPGLLAIACAGMLKPAVVKMYSVALREEFVLAALLTHQGASRPPAQPLHREHNHRFRQRAAAARVSPSARPTGSTAGGDKYSYPLVLTLVSPLGAGVYTTDTRILGALEAGRYPHVEPTVRNNFLEALGAEANGAVGAPPPCLHAARAPSLLRCFSLPSSRPSPRSSGTTTCCSWRCERAPSSQPRGARWHAEARRDTCMRERAPSSLRAACHPTRVGGCGRGWECDPASLLYGAWRHETHIKHETSGRTRRTPGARREGTRSRGPTHLPSNTRSSAGESIASELGRTCTHCARALSVGSVRESGGSSGVRGGRRAEVRWAHLSTRGRSHASRPRRTGHDAASRRLRATSGA